MDTSDGKRVAGEVIANVSDGVVIARAGNRGPFHVTKDQFYAGWILNNRDQAEWFEARKNCEVTITTNKKVERIRIDGDDVERAN